MLIFSLAGSSNPLDELIGDILDSTDSSNLLAGIEVNSTTPPQSQQMQHCPMIIPPTSVHSLQPTAVGIVSPGMVPHGVMHPQTIMPPIRPVWWRGRAIWDDVRIVCEPDSNGQTW